MKILIRKSGKGSNVYITKSYRSKGKSTSQIVEKLGKLEDLDKIYGNGMDFVMKERSVLCPNWLLAPVSSSSSFL